MKLRAAGAAGALVLALSLLVTPAMPAVAADPTVEPGVVTLESPEQPRIFDVLTVDPGDWGPDPVELSYQWWHQFTGAPPEVIEGATDSTFTIPSGAFGGHFFAVVTGSKDGYESVSVSSPLSVIAKEALWDSITPTRVFGVAKVDRLLRAIPGTFTPDPERTLCDWKGDGVHFAYGCELVVKPFMLGTRLSVTVNAIRNGYVKGYSYSAETSPVAEAYLTPKPTPTISGTVRVGKTLTVKPGTWGPGTVVLHYRWKADDKSISGATKTTLKLSRSLAGKRISVTVTATKAGYTKVVKNSSHTQRVK